MAGHGVSRAARFGPASPRTRRAAAIGAAAALAAGTLVAASGSVRSADWAEHFSRAPSASQARDELEGASRLEAAASALMAASRAQWRVDRDGTRDRSRTQAAGSEQPFGARIIPARLVDGGTRAERAAPTPPASANQTPATVPPPGAPRPAATAVRQVAAAAVPSSRTAGSVKRLARVPVPPRRPTSTMAAQRTVPATGGVATAGATPLPPPAMPAERVVQPTSVTPPAAVAIAPTLPGAAEPSPSATYTRAGEERPASDGGAAATIEPPAAPTFAPPGAGAVAPGATAPSVATARRARALLPEVVGIGHALAEEPPPPPPPLPSQSEIVRLVRALSTLQDDMARGSGAALNAQAILMRTIAEVFTSADPRLWGEAQNARSLALYALSGGSPQVVRAVVAKGTLDATFEPVLAGALAYLEGRAEDARRHFGTVDPAVLDPSLEGPFYLAHAALRVENDTKAALRDLDAARFSAPGSLVEEAALRRAILIAAETDDVDSFDRLVNRYLRRFRESVYAGNFRRRLAAAVTRMAFITEPGAFERLDRVLGPMTAGSRQELYLLVSRAAVENGSRRAAALAAERAAATADDGTLDAARARLYRAAALVVDPVETDTAIETLKSLREEALPAEDAALLTAALELGAAVTEMPVREGAGPETTPASADPSGPDLSTADAGASAADVDGPDESLVAAVEARAGALLEAVDLLLAETGDQP